MAKLLIRKGAFMDMQSYLGVISERTSTDLLSFVISTWHDTPYHSAVYANDINVLFDVIKSEEKWRSFNGNHSLDSSTHSSQSEIFTSSDKDATSVVAVASSAGNSTYSLGIESKDQAGFTPLHLAIYLNRPDCVKVLLENGASIRSAIIHDGKTALHLACAFGHIKIFNLIISELKRLYDRKDSFLVL